MAGDGVNTQDQDIDDKSEGHAGAGSGPVRMGQGKVASGGMLSLPIKGESKWVLLMRMLAGSTVGGILVIMAVFQFLAVDDGVTETRQLEMIFGGIIFLLVLEYAIFLWIVIPRNAAYGRYVIQQTVVDYYPLTRFGLGVSARRKQEPVANFLGITTRSMADKSGKAAFSVYLVHKTEKGKSINIKSFSKPLEAEDYAGRLGDTLGLNVASGLRAKKKRAV